MKMHEASNAGLRVLSLAAALVLLFPFTAQARSIILQGDGAATAVLDAGGRITHHLDLIRAVAADVTPEQEAALAAHPGVDRIWNNGALEVATHNSQGNDNPKRETFYPTQVGAADLHGQGIDGSGVTVAVIDTGFWRIRGLKKNAANERRVLAQYDAICDHLLREDGRGDTNDWNGHGSHVTGVIMDSTKSRGQDYRGVAPGADLVSVKAFDFEGKSTYATVIRALDWVVSNRDAYGIRVANLSFSAPPQSFYWDDPINQAVMATWQAGIVVVTSAGNTGPEAVTIGVPGNVP
ncbi:MAG: S8 family serine peptidase, partial [Acidobacteriota bacterium]